jgi:hypothetical protein
MRAEEMAKIGLFGSNLEGMSMSRKDQLHRHKNPYYKIDQLESDDIPLNEEEQVQLDSEDDEYVTLEDVKRDLNL